MAELPAQACRVGRTYGVCVRHGGYYPRSFVCVFCCTLYEYRSAVMGLYQKVSGTAPLLAALKGRFRLFTFSPFDENTTISPFHLFTFSPFHLFTFSRLTKTPRFHIFTFSPFHLFTFDENTTISQFHIFTFSHHQSPETMLSPLISTLRQAEIHELVLSKEEATHADRLRKSDRITIDVDLCRLSCG